MIGITQPRAYFLSRREDRQTQDHTDFTKEKYEVLRTAKDHAGIKSWVNRGTDVGLRQEGCVGVSEVRQRNGTGRGRS